MRELCAHRATDHFGIPEIHGTRQCDGSCSGEGGRCAKDGSDVAWVLNAVEKQEPAPGTDFEGIKRARRYFADGNHTLRGFGLRGAAEIFFRDFRDLNVRLLEALPEGQAARCGNQLWSHKRASNLEAGSQKLLDGSNAFGDEQ